MFKQKVKCEKQELFISLSPFQTIYALLLQISKFRKLRLVAKFNAQFFCLKNYGRVIFLTKSSQILKYQILKEPERFAP